MQKLHFCYEMQIAYTEPVSRCHFTIKCLPKETVRQKVEDYKITLCPANGYSKGVDGLKNLQIYGINEEPHDHFLFRIEGSVVTDCADYEEETDANLDMVFAHPYGFNRAGETIRSFFDKSMEEYQEYQSSAESVAVGAVSGSVDAECGSLEKMKIEKLKSDKIPLSILDEVAMEKYQKALFLMHALHARMEYKAGVTTVTTSGEDAFSKGQGVCQDYAHIFISLLHLAGLPARYVTGLLIGEGASHAWVEVLIGDKWYGLDPTNDCVVAGDHIKLAVGRDARDCMINRGIMHGLAQSTQKVWAVVAKE